MKLLQFFLKHDPLSLMGLVLAVIGITGLLILFLAFPKEGGIIITFCAFALFGLGFLGMEDSCITTFKAFHALRKKCRGAEREIVFKKGMKSIFFKGIHTGAN
jgi:hypothetical protein